MNCCMSTLYCALLVTTAVGTLLVPDGSSKFQSSAARTALAKYNSELNKMQIQFNKKLTPLRVQLLKTLETERKTASQKNNQNEAVKLARAIQTMRPLSERLVGTRWKWHTGALVAEFGDGSWRLTGSGAGAGIRNWQPISSHAIRSFQDDGVAEFMFNTSMNRFLYVNEAGVMRTGVLIEK